MRDVFWFYFVVSFVFVCLFSFFYLAGWLLLVVVVVVVCFKIMNKQFINLFARARPESEITVACPGVL